jgi:Ca2+-dependent lipid-binding protein
LDCPTTDLSDIGLKFIVKDWDLAGTNDLLGTVEVPYPTLVRGNGDAMEFQITPPEGVDKEAGYLLLRFRNATKDDIEALNDKKHPRNLFPTTTQEATSAAWAFLREPEKDDTVPELNAETNSGAKLDASAHDNTPDMASQIHLKIEIASCRHLIEADKGGTSDPYVKVLMGGKDLHKTKHILKT